MRENGYLMKSESDYNMPMQRYVELGLFEIKESSIANPDGSTRLSSHVCEDMKLRNPICLYWNQHCDERLIAICVSFLFT